MGCKSFQRLQDHHTRKNGETYFRPNDSVNNCSSGPQSHSQNIVFSKSTSIGFIRTFLL